MRTGAAASNIADTVRDTAKEAESQLRAAGENLAHGVREGMTVASESLKEGARHASGAVDTIRTGASDAGRDAYRVLADRTGEAIAGVDRVVARNPVGALVAAMGVGLVLGFLARR